MPDRSDAFVEVRLEPSDVAHAARLGASAELTVVFDELGKAEKNSKKTHPVPAWSDATQRFALGSRVGHGG